jgi:hypothetical protein
MRDGCPSTKGNNTAQRCYAGMSFESAENKGQNCRKGLDLGKMTALEEAYGKCRIE